MHREDENRLIFAPYKHKKKRKIMSVESNVIRKYNTYLRLEKGLSPNSIAAYMSDVEKLANFIEDEHLSLPTLTYAHLQQFISHLHDACIDPRSQARIVSGIKSFFRFLILDGFVSADPTELLESPKIAFRLPEILSTEEVDAIISSIDLSMPEGQRNKAIIETLYSCGLRVSELTALKCSDVYPEEGFIRVIGKGSKQRLVPISETALNEIGKYTLDRNLMKIKKGHEDTLFLNRRGAGLTRVMIFYIIKEQARIANVTKTISPHTFRHSFATHLLEGGAHLIAIKTMLGHEKISTTEIYTHIDRSTLRQQILTHHPRNRNYKTQQGQNGHNI